MKSVRVETKENSSALELLLFEDIFGFIEEMLIFKEMHWLSIIHFDLLLVLFCEFAFGFVFVLQSDAFALSGIKERASKKACTRNNNNKKIHVEILHRR